MSEAALARRLGAFIELERALRAAPDVEALRFVLCNRLGRLVRLDTVVAVERARTVRATAVTGVSGFEDDAPLVAFARDAAHAAAREAAAARDAGPDAGPDAGSDAPSIVALEAPATAGLTELGLDAALVVDLGPGTGSPGTRSRGGAGSASLVLLRRGGPFTEPERRIAAEARDAAAHAWRALLAAPARGRGSSGRPTRFAGTTPSRRWLRAGVAAGLVALALLPVRQSVMADAEIVAARPEVVVAGIDGVVRELLVAPNERVRAGQVLVRLDDVELAQERARLVAELALARDRLREARQSALGREPSGSLLAELEAEIDLKRLDLEFVDERLARLELRAASDGVALYSSERDWLGRAVRTGEKLMEVAVDGERRIEAWVAVGDAIELEPGSAVKFFPDAFPLDALAGTVRSTSFFARRTPEDALAYRVVSVPASESSLVGPAVGPTVGPAAPGAAPRGTRLGTKGSARLYGERAALGYQLLRRPLGAARRLLGV